MNWRVRERCWAHQSTAAWNAMSIHIRAHSLILLICPPSHTFTEYSVTSSTQGYRLSFVFLHCFLALLLLLLLLFGYVLLHRIHFNSCIFGQYSVIGQLIINCNKLTPFQLMNRSIHETHFRLTDSYRLSTWIATFWFSSVWRMFFFPLPIACFDFQKKLIFKRNHYRILCVSVVSTWMIKSCMFFIYLFFYFRWFLNKNHIKMVHERCVDLQDVITTTDSVFCVYVWGRHGIWSNACYTIYI